jgi:two-component system CheB/CheR fusion protein
LLLRIQQKKYDLILMDLQMPPVMNGFWCLTKYEINEFNIPIIALTADVTSIDVEKALAGRNEWLYF